MPIGVLTAVDRPTIIRLPTMALRPPPSLPGAGVVQREQVPRQRAEALDQQREQDPGQEAQADRHRQHRQRDADAVRQQARR
jgi:hypothetical protein